MSLVTVRPSTGVYFRDLAGGSLFDMTTALPPAELGASLADDSDSSFVTIVGSDDNRHRRGTMACVDFAPIPDLDVFIDPDGPQRFPTTISIRVERIPLPTDPAAAIWGLVQQSADEQLSTALFAYEEMLTGSPDWRHVPDTPTWLTHDIFLKAEAVDLIRTEGLTFATTLYDGVYTYADDGDVARYRVFEVSLTLNVAAPISIPTRLRVPALRQLQRGGPGGIGGIPRAISDGR